MTSKAEIASWLKRGVDQNATHCIIVCDTFDYTDYPVYVKEGENVKEIEATYNKKSMQRVMEVYNLKEDLTAQLALERVSNY